MNTAAKFKNKKFQDKKHLDCEYNISSILSYYKNTLESNKLEIHDELVTMLDDYPVKSRKVIDFLEKNGWFFIHTFKPGDKIRAPHYAKQACEVLSVTDATLLGYELGMNREVAIKAYTATLITEEQYKMEQENWNYMIEAAVKFSKGIPLYNTPIPKYGDLIELKRWFELVEDGAVGYDDGNGYWANSYGYENREISEYNIFHDEKMPEGATHVLWFNK